MLSPRSFFLHAYISDTYLPIRFSLHLFVTKMGRRNVQTFGEEVFEPSCSKKRQKKGPNLETGLENRF